MTALAILMLAGPGTAQETPLEWTGQVRLRGEADDRDFTRGNAVNAYALSRIRLGLRAVPVDDVIAFIQIQDSRVFGEERTSSGQFSTLADMKNIDLHQGYLEVRHVFAPAFTVRAGRMELSYGNERVIGAVGWSNVGRSFDGILVAVRAGDAAVDLLAMNTGETSVPPSAATPGSVAGVRDQGQALYGAYGAFAFAGSHALDVYALYQTNLAESTPGSADLLRFTGGVLATLRPAGWTLELEAAVQAGSAGARTVSAYLAAGAARWETPWTGLAAIRGSVEALSGTPEDDPGFKTFDPPFHTGHKFYGWMDYFVNIPAQTGGGGLLDINVRADGRISDRVSWTVVAHSFSLMEPRGGRRALGQELDLLLTWASLRRLSFDLGGAAFLPGPPIREAFGGTSAGLWGYVAATVTF